MADMEKVLKGLEHCVSEEDCRGCIYFEQFLKDEKRCACHEEAISVIRERNQRIWELITENDRLKDLLREKER